MPRPLREDFAGAIHHVFARGNRRQLIFRDDDDFGLYLRLLCGVVLAKKWQLLAYCLMPNHVHLLIETPEPTLAGGMQHLHGLYARIFNDRHEEVGHVFQGRYGSTLVRDDAQLFAVARYVALNPVASALCANAADWEWSSYPAVMADDPPSFLDSDRLLAHLSSWGGDGRRVYRDLVSPARGVLV